MYRDVAYVNLSYHKFEYEGEMLTQEECINRMIKGCETFFNQGDYWNTSEEDLKLRGPGDFFGNRQHGLPALKIADLATDSNMLSVVAENAERIISEDPELMNPENQGLRSEVMRLFSAAHD